MFDQAVKDTGIARDDALAVDAFMSLVDLIKVREKYFNENRNSPEFLAGFRSFFSKLSMDMGMAPGELGRIMQATAERINGSAAALDRFAENARIIPDVLDAVRNEIGRARLLALTKKFPGKKVLFVGGRKHTSLVPGLQADADGTRMGTLTREQIASVARWLTQEGKKSNELTNPQLTLPDVLLLKEPGKPVLLAKAGTEKQIMIGHYYEINGPQGEYQRWMRMDPKLRARGGARVWNDPRSEDLRISMTEWWDDLDAWEQQEYVSLYEERIFDDPLFGRMHGYNKPGTHAVNAAKRAIRNTIKTEVGKIGWRQVSDEWYRNIAQIVVSDLESKGRLAIPGGVDPGRIRDAFGDKIEEYLRKLSSAEARAVGWWISPQYVVQRVMHMATNIAWQATGATAKIKKTGKTVPLRMTIKDDAVSNHQTMNDRPGYVRTIYMVPVSGTVRTGQEGKTTLRAIELFDLSLTPQEEETVINLIHTKPGTHVMLLTKDAMKLAANGPAKVTLQSGMGLIPADFVGKEATVADSCATILDGAKTNTLQDLPENGMVRMSPAGLYRIKVMIDGAEHYLVSFNYDKWKKTGKLLLSPIGGAYEFTGETGKQQYTDAGIAMTPDDEKAPMEMRQTIARKDVEKFLDLFNLGIGRDQTPVRELQEELVGQSSEERVFDSLPQNAGLAPEEVQLTIASATKISAEFEAVAVQQLTQISAGRPDDAELAEVARLAEDVRNMGAVQKGAGLAQLIATHGRIQNIYRQVKDPNAKAAAGLAWFMSASRLARSLESFKDSFKENPLKTALFQHQLVTQLNSIAYDPSSDPAVQAIANAALQRYVLTPGSLLHDNASVRQLADPDVVVKNQRKKQKLILNLRGSKYGRAGKKPDEMKAAGLDKQLVASALNILSRQDKFNSADFKEKILSDPIILAGTAEKPDNYYRLSDVMRDAKALAADAVAALIAEYYPKGSGTEWLNVYPDVLPDTTVEPVAIGIGNAAHTKPDANDPVAQLRAKTGRLPFVPCAVNTFIFVEMEDGSHQLLVQCRSTNKGKYPGRLDTVHGGHVRAGEKLADTSTRELKEELGGNLKVVSIGYQRAKAGEAADADYHTAHNVVTGVVLNREESKKLLDGLKDKKGILYASADNEAELAALMPGNIKNHPAFNKDVAALTADLQGASADEKEIAYVFSAPIELLNTSYAASSPDQRSAWWAWGKANFLENSSLMNAAAKKFNELTNHSAQLTLPSTDINRKSVALAPGVMISRLGTDGIVMAHELDIVAYVTQIGFDNHHELSFDEQQIKGAQWWNHLSLRAQRRYLADWANITDEQKLERQRKIAVMEEQEVEKDNFEIRHKGKNLEKIALGKQFIQFFKGRYSGEDVRHEIYRKMQYVEYLTRVNTEAIAEIARDVALALGENENGLLDERLYYKLCAAIVRTAMHDQIYDMGRLAGIATHLAWNLTHPEDEQLTIGDEEEQNIHDQTTHSKFSQRKSFIAAVVISVFANLGVVNVPAMAETSQTVKHNGNNRVLPGQFPAIVYHNDQLQLALQDVLKKTFNIPFIQSMIIGENDLQPGENGLGMAADAMVLCQRIIQLLYLTRDERTLRRADLATPLLAPVTGKTDKLLKNGINEDALRYLGEVIRAGQLDDRLLMLKMILVKEEIADNKLHEAVSEFIVSIGIFKALLMPLLQTEDQPVQPSQPSAPSVPKTRNGWYEEAALPATGQKNILTIPDDTNAAGKIVKLGSEKQAMIERFMPQTWANWKKAGFVTAEVGARFWNRMIAGEGTKQELLNFKNIQERWKKLPLEMQKLYIAQLEYNLLKDPLFASWHVGMDQPAIEKGKQSVLFYENAVLNHPVVVPVEATGRMSDAKLIEQINYIVAGTFSVLFKDFGIDPFGAMVEGRSLQKALTNALFEAHKTYARDFAGTNLYAPGVLSHLMHLSIHIALDLTRDPNQHMTIGDTVQGEPVDFVIGAGNTNKILVEERLNALTNIQGNSLTARPIITAALYKMLHADGDLSGPDARSIVRDLDQLKFIDTVATVSENAKSDIRSQIFSSLATTLYRLESGKPSRRNRIFRYNLGAWKPVLILPVIFALALSACGLILHGKPALPVDDNDVVGEMEGGPRPYESPTAAPAAPEKPALSLAPKENPYKKLKPARKDVPEEQDLLPALPFNPATDLDEALENFKVLDFALVRAMRENRPATVIAKREKAALAAELLLEKFHDEMVKEENQKAGEEADQEPVVANTGIDPAFIKRLNDSINDLGPLSAEDARIKAACLRVLKSSTASEERKKKAQETLDAMLKRLSQKHSEIPAPGTPAFLAMFLFPGLLFPAGKGIAGGVQKILSPWSSDTLKALAQKSVVFVADPEHYAEALAEARELAGRAVPVTILTTPGAEQAARQARRNGVYAGGITAGADGNTHYTGMKFVEENEEHNGTTITILTASDLHGASETAEFSREDLVAAASNVLGAELESGYRKDDLGGRPAWLRVNFGSAKTQAAIVRAKGTGLEDYNDIDWTDRAQLMTDLQTQAQIRNARDGRMQDRLARQKKNASEPTVVSSEGSLETLALAGANNAGVITDQPAFAKSLAEQGGSAAYFSNREPGSNDPMAVDWATIDMGRYVDQLTSMKLISPEQNLALNRLLAQTRRKDDNSDTVPGHALKTNRDVKLDVATNLVRMLRENGKETLFAAKTPEALLQLAGVHQIQQAHQDIKALGITRGQAIGKISDASNVTEWLKIVSAVSFETAEATEIGAEAQFKKILALKSQAMREGTIAKDPKIAFKTRDPKLAVLAERYGFDVQFVIADIAELGVPIIRDAIAVSNAAVVVEKAAIAEEAVKNGVSKVVATSNAFGEDGSVNRLYGATSQNARPLEAIFGLVKAAIDRGNEIKTPEGRFNAGARQADDHWRENMTEAAAKAYLAGKNVRADLIAAKTAAASGDLELNREFGRQYVMAGIAMMIVYIGGNLDAQALENNIPLRNLLAEAFMNKDADLKKLGEELNLAKVPQSEPKDAFELFKFLGSGENTKRVSFEISTHFERPAQARAGEPYSAAYLTIAAQVLLGIVKSDLTKMDYHAAKQAGETNMKLFEEVLTAA